MVGPVFHIWRKELLDTVRDRKALAHALVVPLGIGVLYAVLNPALTRLAESRAEEPLDIPVQGLEHADPELARVLSLFGITLVPYEGDMEGAVGRGEEAAGLRVPEGFAETVRREENATLVLLTNRTAGGLFAGPFSLKRLDAALGAYNRLVSLRRLRARDLGPDVLAPVALDARDLATPAQKAGLFASILLPLLVAIVAAQGGLFIAIDVTAGEKERGTLEALLATPASDLQIYLGKLAAVFSLTSVPVVLTLAGFWAANRLLPASMTHGAVLPAAVVLRTLVVALPMALFLNVVLLVISIRTKAFKDAQSSALPLFFVVMALAMAAAFVPPAHPALHLIPVYGASAVVGSFASGADVPALPILLSVAGSLAGAGLGSLLALGLFHREKLLYRM